MKKGGGSESNIIIGPSKSVLVYALRIRLRPCPISGVLAKIIIRKKFMNLSISDSLKDFNRVLGLETPKVACWLEFNLGQLSR